MAKLATTLAMIAALLTPPLALAQDYDAGKDSGERDIFTHASEDEIRSVLTEEGYTNIILADRLRGDAFIDMQATNPDGERVQIRLDNTGNILQVRPLAE